MEVLFSPWKDRFLNQVAKTSQDIWLVSPFIKLSMVRPFLTFLPDRNITINVVTRFNKYVFIQGASDLLALELLIRRPGAEGPTRLRYLNTLHAKCYIFDKKIAFLGSSNLTISGLENNLEMAVALDESTVAESLIERITRRSSTFSDLVLSTIESMRSTLRIEPLPRTAPTEVITVDEDAESLELAETSDANAVQPLSDLATSGYDELDAKDTGRKLRHIEDSLHESSIRYLNYIGDTPSEVAGLTIERDSEGRLTQNYIEQSDGAAKRDLERLDHYVRSKLPVLGSLPKDVDLTVVVLPFVHRSWSTTFKEQATAGLEQQRFGTLGRCLVKLEAAVHFARQVAFADVTAEKPSLALANLSNLDFESFLANKGLDCFLHVIPDFKKDVHRRRTETLVGILSYYGSHDVARQFIRPFVDEHIAPLKSTEAEKDPKNIVQEALQHLNEPFHYEVDGPFGPDHSPEFQSTLVVGKSSVARGKGTSKKAAERDAALNALIKFQSNKRLHDAVTYVQYGEASADRGTPYKLSSARLEEMKAAASALGLYPKRSFALLDFALTHQSYRGGSARSYQRLAFVGSQLLELLIQEYEIYRYGWLKKDKSQLDRTIRPVVDKELLDVCYASLKSDKYVLLGKTQQVVTPSIRRDVMQAVFAVAYLWNGIDKARAMFQTDISARLDGIDFESDHATRTIFSHDPVGLLQELLQSEGKMQPRFTYLQDNAPHHKQHIARCVVENQFVGSGKARTKKEARQVAARAALQELYPEHLESDSD